MSEDNDIVQHLVKCPKCGQMIEKKLSPNGAVLTDQPAVHTYEFKGRYKGLGIWGWCPGGGI